MDSRRAVLLSFLAAFLTIGLELLLSKVFHFYLGVVASYSAIPFVLFGLSLGSFLTQQGLPLGRLRLNHYLLLFIVSSLAAFFLLFFLSSNFLIPLVVIKANKLSAFPFILRALVFGTLFLLPFLFAGCLFSALFRNHASIIGKLYFADFAGGALACLIVPFGFHSFSLPSMLMCFFLLSIILYSIVANRSRWLIIQLCALLLGVFIFNFTLETKANLKRMFFSPAVELEHIWNEYGRAALVELPEAPYGYLHQLMVDDRASNIYMREYVPEAPPEETWEEYLPKLWKMDVRNVLVIFAGCGKDMIFLNQVFDGQARITGVEINPALLELCLGNEKVKDQYNIESFLKLPNITLDIAEGRGYLSRLKDKKFEVVFIGAEGTTASDTKLERTGLYLLTREGFNRYLELLTKSGIMIFGHQTSYYKRIPTLRSLHENSLNSNIEFARTILVGDTFTVYKPSGFHESEIAAYLSLHENDEALFVSGHKNSNPVLVDIVSGKYDESLNVMTDDRPYAFPLTLNSFKRQIDENGHIANLSTLLRYGLTVLLATATLAFLLLFRYQLRGVGPSVLHFFGYFFLTGFAYMCLQIGFLNKFTFFLDNSLYTMAFVISVFMLSNGVGSWILGASSTLQRVGMEKLLIMGATLVILTVVLVNYIVVHCLSSALIIKFLLLAVTIAPIAMLLGMFYPLGVLEIEARKLNSIVPFTYGISTASSILGACYALLMSRNLGYNLIMLHAAACYLITILAISKRSNP